MTERVPEALMWTEPTGPDENWLRDWWIIPDDDERYGGQIAQARVENELARQRAERKAGRFIGDEEWAADNVP